MEAEFTAFHAIILGLVQGVAEYLPISSSAHLILLPRFLGVTDPGLGFDVLLHVGTLFATLAFFWRDWSGLISDGWRHAWGDLRSLMGLRLPALVGRELPWFSVVLATVPALVAGALLHGWVKTVFRGNAVMAVALVVGGVALYAADRLTHGGRRLQKSTLRDYLWVGVAQCFALVPGVSRSGSTLIGGRLAGLSREAAARFSFLISAPVTLAAIVFELRHWDEIVASASGWQNLMLGTLAAFVAGWLAIGGLLKFLRRFGFLSFAVYRVILAVAIVLVLGL